MAFSLAQVQYLLIDLDGVLFRGTRALPGAAAFVGWLRTRGKAFRLVTNNSTLQPDQVAAKLRAMGIPASGDEVLTSAMATALYLKGQGANQTAYVIGEEGLTTALTSVDIRITDNRPNWVVVGLDRAVTYDKLRLAALALESGARFVGSNPDTSLPTEEGLAPGAGAILAAITATTGAQPKIIGKPEPTMLRLGMEQLGGTLDNTAMLGDRLDTDIAAAANLGMPSILILTGVSTRVEAEQSTIHPTLIVENLAILTDHWTNALKTTSGQGG